MCKEEGNDSAYLHEAVEQGGLAMLNQDVAHFHLCTTTTGLSQHRMSLLES